ncbi:hypothetical protein C7T94_02440 [Pedobacter yulinensis]|uniref:Uncharacterized protein n=1 Tax=Pedobacter yulinensis TaxID=2126353 RepID=A0A2T3HRA4_9SPHI|nr:hypothetical protein [Pedobacter yulinensis]PST84995.1 hypothetical protein C7T94_02440 [Pedobacter yulinensis]
MKFSHIFYLLFTVLFSNVALGQIIRIPDQNGKAVATKSYDNIKGSAFLTKDWTTGTVTLADGTTYQDVQLKYDQVEDKIRFKRNDKELEFTVPVKQFSISGNQKAHVFTSGFPAVNTNSAASFYEVLVDGQVKLLKRTKKVVIETKGYNEFLEKRFDSNVEYFILDQNKIYEIKPSKKGVSQAVADQGLKAGELLKTQPVKNEADLTALIQKLNAG